MLMRNFESWTYEEIENTFGIVEIDNSLLFDEWMQANFPTNEHEKYNLDRLKYHLFKRVEAWNEDELKMFFIGPLVEMAEIESATIKAFTQRSFSATIQDIEVGGKVDFLLAKGKQKPSVPLFCLHEYTCTERSRSEQENRRDNDPKGQVLIAMLVAQHLNQKNIPILGAYISGRSWFFILLQDNSYIVSNAFNGSNDDIYKIFSLLRKSKEIIGRFETL